jgi:glucose uptake protein
MILPQSYAAALFVAILACLCWASWANTFKAAGRLRFELYYFDFAFGLIIAALIYAYTLGSLGFDGFSLQDDLLHAGKRQWLYAFASGVTFNFANMLLLSAVSIAGMTIAFPAALGVASIIASCLMYASRPSTGGGMLFAGCALILGAVVVDALIHRQMATLRYEELARAGKTKSTRRPGSAKPVVLSIVAGLLMGTFSQLIDKARDGDIGLGPYGLGLMFGLGAFFTTFILNMFFMNLPVEGEPVEITDYFKTKFGQHLLGIVGGALWFTGVLAAFIAAPVVQSPHIPPALSVALLNSAGLIAALWGVFAWRELRHGDTQARSLAALMLALFACGVALLSLAAMNTRGPV